MNEKERSNFKNDMYEVGKQLGELFKAVIKEDSVTSKYTNELVLLNNEIDKLKSENESLNNYLNWLFCEFYTHSQLCYTLTLDDFKKYIHNQFINEVKGGKN